MWVSTQLAELEVAPPFVGGKIEMAAAEQGKPAQVLCNLEQKKPFEGKAKVQLLGLPPNATAAQRGDHVGRHKGHLRRADEREEPVGPHKTLFCVVTVTQDGEPIVQSIAGGGVLRIDAPPPAPAARPQPPRRPRRRRSTGDKPLSRLEKLRLEQAADEAVKS